MKKTLDAHVQLALVLILGCFGLALRLAAYRWAVDEKGLLGALTGGLTSAAGGIAAALVFGYLACLLFKGKPKS